MRKIILALLLFSTAFACSAAPTSQGRWEGSIQIPGRTLPFVVDLAESDSRMWTGSIIIPGLGIKGAPLTNLAVTDKGVSFDLGRTLTNTTYGPAQFKAQRTASDTLAGEMRQAGNIARFSLAKTGPAQVESATRSTAVASVLASGVADAQSAFRGDADHAGSYRSDAPREFHRVKWKFPTGDRIVSSPVYADGVIYFGGDDGNVYAVDAAEGRQIWKRKTGGPVPSTPAIAGEMLYVASYDGKFYALDKRTGAPRWKFTTGGERRFEAKNLHGFQPKNQTVADPFDVFLSSPVLGRGMVYFGSGDGYVYALDAASGDLKWKFRTGDVVHSSPAYADGVIYFGSWDSYFYAVDASSGEEKWRFHGGEDPLIHNQVGFQSSPAVVNGVVYTGCRDSNLYAIDAATGKEKWRFNNSGSWVISSPAVVRGKVIFATSDSSLYHVLDAETGKSLVRQQGKAFVFSSPSVAGDSVAIGVLNGTLEVRDFESGALRWEFQTEASVRNEGWVLTADRKFNGPLLYASNWREGPLVSADRQFGIGSIFSSPLIAGGVVYFGSTDGNLYAVE